MNKARRTALARALALIAEAQAIVEEAAAEERDYFDAMPESLQGSERGEGASFAADTLDEAVGMLEEAAGRIDEASQ